MEMAQCPRFYLGEALEYRDWPETAIHGDVSDERPQQSNSDYIKVCNKLWLRAESTCRGIRVETHSPLAF